MGELAGQADILLPQIEGLNVILEAQSPKGSNVEDWKGVGMKPVQDGRSDRHADADKDLRNVDREPHKMG